MNVDVMKGYPKHEDIKINIFTQKLKFFVNKTLMTLQFILTTASVTSMVVAALCQDPFIHQELKWQIK